ncbi:MAG TPA: type II secretion system F family protein [Nocardioidaceae bacterium]|nr:type II secretion system F family protein [Nocardioidaceae bacterium]
MSGLALLAVGAAGAAAALAVPPAPSFPPGTAHPTGRSGPRGDPPVLRLLGASSVALVALVFLGGALGPPVAIVGAACCWWVTGRMEPPALRRRRERLAASVPHAVDLMAACLAVGLSPAAALEQVTAAVDEPLADELAEVSARLRVGVDPVTVWRDLAGHPQLGGLGRAVSRAVDSGASVSDAMLRLAEDLRGRDRAEVETRARAVGVKAALPLGVCLLPAFVLVGIVPLVAGSLSVLTAP